VDGVREIGIGMIGYGFMGRAHVNAYRTLSYVLHPPPSLPGLVAVAGRHEQGVREAAARYGFTRHYTDWERLVEDPGVDLLDNGGPNDLHAAPSIAAAEAGKHVICEKPMARDALEARRMLEAARRSGIKHMVAFNYRFVPAVRLAYDLVRAGDLGEIRGFRAAYLQDWLSDPAAPHTWRLDRKSAGSGALGDLGSHVIDLARFLVGEPRWVSATTRTFIGERPLPGGSGRRPVDVDDAFAATIEFDGGCLGTLEASRFAAGRKNHLKFEINGSAGSLSFDLERLNELRANWMSGTREATRGWTEVLVTEADHPFISDWWPPGHVLGWEHTFVHELAHFLDAVANDRPVAPLGATFEDGYRNALVCDAILRSAEEGRRVEVSP
jgi:predicted dehydrogenase